MRIRTQFLLTMFLFGVVLVAIAVSALVTTRQVSQASNQAALARKVAQGASELGYLANDYIVFREAQLLERWRSRFLAFSDDAAALQPSNPEAQVLARNIQANVVRLRDVFDNVVAFIDRTASGSQGRLDPSQLQVGWSRVAVQTQALVSDASRLADQVSRRVDRLQLTNLMVTAALIAVFGAYFVANYWLVQRRLLRAIATLQAGTAVVGSGALDFRINESRDDEIGDLSHAFNRMTADLESVTAQVRQERQRYQQLFDLAPDGYVVTDRAGVIQEANHAMGELLAMPVHDLRGQKLEQWVDPADAGRFAALLGQLAVGQGELPLHTEMHLVPHTGATHLAVAITISASAQGEAEGLRWLLRDVTRDKQMHAALVHSEKLSMAGRLAASFAHEINNPLGAAMGCAELALEATEAGEDPSEHLQVIGVALGRAARIVGRLRELQRPTMIDAREPADLNEMMEHVLLLTRKKAISSSVEVSWQPDPQAARPVVAVDAIQQVFLNLVLNAVEAMSNQGGHLDIRLVQRQWPASLGIQFADNGPGLAPSVLERLYEPFITTKQDGTGLGLFISQSIVQQHGGTIDLETATGQGATFTVWLPL